MNNGLTITVNAATAQAASELQRFFTGFQSQLSAVTQLGSGLNQLLAGLGAGLGVSALAGFVDKNIEAARALGQLEAALKSTGQFSAANTAALAAQREELGRLAGVDDDHLVAAQKMLLVNGATMEQMPHLTQLALDLAAAQGGDVVDSAVQLGRAMSGQAVMLRGIRLEIDQSLPRYLQIQQLFDQLDRRYSGQASARHLVAPEQDDLAVQRDELEKAIGGTLRSDVVTPFLQGFGPALASATAGLKNFNQNYPAFSQALQDSARLMGALTPYILPVAAALAAVVTVSGALGLAWSALAPVVSALSQTFTGLSLAELIKLFTGGALAAGGFGEALKLLAALAARAAIVFAGLWGAMKIVELAKAVTDLKAALSDEDTGSTRLGAQFDALNKSIQTNIDQLVQAGLMTADFGAQTRAGLEKARAGWAAGTISAGSYLTTLKTVAEHTGTVLRAPENQPALAQAQGFQLHEETIHPDPRNAAPGFTEAQQHYQDARAEQARDLALALAQTDAQIESLASQLAEKNLKDSYDQRLSDLAGYFAARKQLAEKSAADETAPLELRLKQNAETAAALKKQLAQYTNAPEGALRDGDLDKKIKLQDQLNKLDIDDLQTQAAIQAAGLKRQYTLAHIGKEGRDNLAVLRQEHAAALDLSVTRSQDQAGNIQNNPDLTDAQKKPLLTAAYQRQADALSASLAAAQAEEEQQRANGESYSASAQKVEALTAQIDGLHQTMQTLAGSDTFSGQFSQVIVGMQNDWGSWARQSADAFSAVWNGAISSISNGISGLIMGTKTWGQTLLAIGSSIVQSIIQSFVQMGVKWAMQHLLMAAISKIFHLQDAGFHVSAEVLKTSSTSTSTGVRSAANLQEAGTSVVTAAADSASSAAKIPYVGWILAAGAFVAMMAMGLSAISGARAAGGPVGSGGTYLVGERGPELFVPDTAGTIIPADQTAAMMAGSGGGGANVSVAAGDVHVAVIHSAAEFARFMESRAGKNIVVRHVRSARNDIGIPA